MRSIAGRDARACGSMLTGMSASGLTHGHALAAIGKFIVTPVRFRRRCVPAFGRCGRNREGMAWNSDPHYSSLSRGPSVASPAVVGKE